MSDEEFGQEKRKALDARLDKEAEALKNIYTEKEETTEKEG